MAPGYWQTCGSDGRTDGWVGGGAPGLVPDRWTAIKKGQVHLDLAVVGKTAVLPTSRRAGTIDAAFPVDARKGNHQRLQ